MRLMPPHLILFLTLPVLSSQPLYGQQVEVLENIWTVAEYDSARDPSADLELTTAKAQAEGKRILLEIGGTWCGWCHRLDLFIREHPSIAERLAEDFVVMKVSWSRENQNSAFLSQYPRIPGYPHIYVLESDGTFLHSQGILELEEGSSYNEEAILGFLQAWAPGRRMIQAHFHDGHRQPLPSQ